MANTNITRLISEVLAEELAKINADSSKTADGQSRGVDERWVQIETDEDLKTFVSDIIGMTESQRDRVALEKGKIVYRLKRAGGRSTTPHERKHDKGFSFGTTQTIESGFFSERQADRISGDIKRLRIGKSVRMTPLARDRLRQRGITIERMDT